MLRVSPRAWPVIAGLSPVLAPVIVAKSFKHRKNRARARDQNRMRIERAGPLDLPELDALDITVMAEQATAAGFEGGAEVSYWVKSERGGVLFDIGYGPALAHNAARLGFSLDDVDALVISHLHLDHMGGMKAQRAREVQLPEILGEPQGKPCFLPDDATAPGFDASVVREPRLLAGGIGSTGQLARSLFFFGWTEEQALVAHVRDKGLVVITGCGHPTIEVILEMAARLSDAPLYAIAGGLHFPITQSRGVRFGLQAQMLLGTGKPPWQRITDDDLTATIATMNAAAPARVLLSAHDTCDHALERFRRELDAEVEILEAGRSYAL